MLYLAKVWCTPKNAQHRMIAWFLKSESEVHATERLAAILKTDPTVVVEKTEIVPATVELIEMWADGYWSVLYNSGVSDGRLNRLHLPLDKSTHPCA